MKVSPIVSSSPTDPAAAAATITENINHTAAAKQVITSTDTSAQTTTTTAAETAPTHRKDDSEGTGETALESISPVTGGASSASSSISPSASAAKDIGTTSTVETTTTLTQQKEPQVQVQSPNKTTTPTATSPPLLETIDPSQVMTSPTSDAPSANGEASAAATPTPAGTGGAASSSAPNTNGGAGSVGGGGSSKGSTSGRSRRSRRTNSDEIPRLVQGHMESINTNTNDHLNNNVHAYAAMNQPYQQHMPPPPPPPQASPYYGGTNPYAYSSPTAAVPGGYEQAPASAWSPSQGARSKLAPPPPPPPPPPTTRRPHHHRTWSDGGPGMLAAAAASGGLPPSHYHYPPAPPTNFGSQQQQQHHQQQQQHPQQVAASGMSSSSPVPGHRKVPSGGDYSSFYSGGGGGTNSHEGAPLLQRYATERIPKNPASTPRRHRSSIHNPQQHHHHHRHHRHRRAHSTSAAVPDAYGSFWQADPSVLVTPGGGGGSGSGGRPPAPGSYDEAVQSLRRHSAANFSPRDDFMSLTHSMRSSSGGGAAVVPDSPGAGSVGSASHRGGGGGSSSRSSRRKRASSFSGPQAPNNITNITWSPMSARATSSAAGIPLPPTPLLSSREGGEAMFYANQQSSAANAAAAGTVAAETGSASQSRRGLYHTHRSESSRKMHMRQQSAQLWMEDVKGQVQPPTCHNVAFLLLFVFHLVFIGFLGNIYGPEALAQHYDMSSSSSTSGLATPGDLTIASSSVTETAAVSTETSSAAVTAVDDMIANTAAATVDDDDEVTVYYHNLLYIGCLAGFFSAAVSMCLLGLMTAFARHFVQVALMIVIALSFIWGTVGIGLSPKSFVPITGIIALALTVAYAFIVWDRIPFATANLLTALSGVKAFPGTIVVAFCFQVIAMAWSLYYAVVVFGVYDSIANGTLPVPNDMRALVFTLLGISFYWTFQVSQNAVQVTTAAVIGGWWYNPDNSAIVRQSVGKTLFYYMGSICFGSLFVGPVRVLRQLSGLVRPTSAENASLMCLHECLNCIQTCISSCVDTIAFNFNAWGFTYVGLYGYGFLDASHNASHLFDKRGWTMIVSDDLVPNILLITSLVLGGVTGCFAHLISALDGLHVTSLGEPGVMSFVEGSVIGLVMTSILFGVISSAVNTVIVCFAASPVDFEENHPDLSHEMRSAWREVWPGALDVLDVRAALTAPAYTDVIES